MLTTINLYCSDCLRTQRFLDLGQHLICEVCSKRLVRVELHAQTDSQTGPKSGPAVVGVSDRSDEEWRQAS